MDMQRTILIATLEVRYNIKHKNSRKVFYPQASKPETPQ